MAAVCVIMPIVPNHIRLWAWGQCFMTFFSCIFRWNCPMSMKLSRDEAKTLMTILVDFEDYTIKCHCYAEDSFRRCTYSVITLYDTYMITSPIQVWFKCPCGHNCSEKCWSNLQVLLWLACLPDLRPIEHWRDGIDCRTHSENLLQQEQDNIRHMKSYCLQ